MLFLHPQSQKTCQGISRRALVQAGGLGLVGLPLSGLLRGEAQANDASSPADKARLDRLRKLPGFGRAESCLVIFLSGGCSHHDTMDMKPDAPAEIRGEFKPIATSVPGTVVCEHLPRVARHVDKFSIVRSLAHEDNNHPSAVYWMLTGHPYPRASNLSENLSREDHPHIGSSLTAVDGAADRPVPTFVTVPDYIAVNGPIRAGQHAGFLGSRFDPLVTQGNPNDDDFQPLDLGLVPAVESTRLDGRRHLLHGINSQIRLLEENRQARSLDNYYEKAFNVLASGKTHRAFDIGREPEKMRERYGRNLFGQSILLGRRLIEAGVRLVHVNWIRIREFAWDTHVDNFNQLREKLLPPTDLAFSALIEDMTASGLLDKTIVIMMGEFGRSPKINPQNAGREHWAPANTIVMAGAGIPPGRIYGATDKDGAYVTDRRISPAQFAATIFHALGVDPASESTTMLARPYRICDEQPVLDLWG